MIVPAIVTALHPYLLTKPDEMGPERRYKYNKRLQLM